MKYVIKFNAVLLLLLINVSSYSQGCSDAGVCTINNFKDHSFNISQETAKRNFFQSGITYGVGEHSITIVNPYIEYTGFISEKISLSGKLTYAFISGELANVSGLGDVIVSANYILMNNEDNLINVVIGSKIPLNSSNLKEEDKPLPMHYQSSLGTYDIIIGANYSFANLGISAALQQPIVNSNENEFIKPTDQNLEEYKYNSTNSFKRKGDVILRVSYNFPIAENKFSIRPGFLGIYHLDEDSYIDENDITQDIDGSKGITLNANLYLNYSFSDSKQLEFSLGFPFITRDSRPDGLTRTLVAGLEYHYSF